MATTMTARDDPAARDAPSPVLRTLVVCDLVESTALVERIGDARASALFRRHDRAARDLIERRRGREIDKTDGFLLLFERPIEALAFALDYQRLLRELGAAEAVPLKARVGVHVGEVVVFENSAADVARGAKRVEVEGLVKPVAARLMGLALPGQILLSGVVHGLTQRAEPELRAQFPKLEWKSHGRYAFKGVPQPMPVHEVGEAGVAPLLRPVATDKAWRSRPLWLRPRALLAELAAVLVLGSLALWVATRTQPAIAFAERDWIVIGSLRNLTGEAGFDESLEVAFRLSVEQSRHVNVVSDLQVRDALARMKRGDAALVDRELGSEIALREGARALVLPTVAEVGGRLRISAEVVDPRTQTTVHAEYADGTGAGSALDSVDRVARAMRARLGEAIRQIDSDAAPLPRVTTSDIDALRAYALALKADAQSRYPDAIALYRSAISIDPEFALAYMGVARVHWNSGDRATARRMVAEARARRDRLRRRDQMYLDAWSTNLDDPVAAIPAWVLMGQVYPDQFGAHYNTAILRWQYENDAAGALEALAGAESPHYPMIASVHFLRGALRTAANDLDGAIESFERARELGVRGTVMSHADALLARREDEAAIAVMRATQASGMPSADVLDRVFDVSLALDSGDAREAARLAHETERAAREASPKYATVFAMLGAASALAARDDRGAQRERLQRLHSALRDALAVAEGADRHDAAFALAALAQIAARAGLPDLAGAALGDAEPVLATLSFDQGTRLAKIARAELLTARGEAAAAIALIEPLLDGREPWQAHAALARAHEAANDEAAALREWRWLAAQRGRAFGEWTVRWLLRGVNLVDLREAERRIEDAPAP